MKRFIHWFNHKASMQTKLQISFAVIVILPLIGLGAYTYVSSRINLVKQTELTMTNNTSTICYGLENNVRRIEEVVDFLSYSSEFRKKLENVNKSPADLSEELTNNIEPQIWYYMSSDTNISEIKIYSEYLPHSIGSFLEIPESEEVKKWYEEAGSDYTIRWTKGSDEEIYAYKALLDNNTASRRIGIIVLKIQHSNFLSLLNQTEYMNNGVYVLGNDDVVFASKTSQNEELDKNVLSVIKDNGIDEYTSEKSYVIAPSNYMINDWRVYYYIDRSGVNGLIKNQLVTTIVLVISAFIIAFIISRMLSKGLSKRIMYLQDVANGVSKGIFDIPYNQEYTDEIGRVEKSLSEMGRRILDIMQELEERREHDVGEKDKVIVQREWVFDYMVEKNQDMAIIYSISTKKADFITSNVTDILGIPREKISENVSCLWDSVKDKAKILDSEKIRQLSVGQALVEEEVEIENVITGECKWYRIAIVHTEHNDGDSFMIAMFDKTEALNRNHQLEEVLNVAKSANEAKTNFLANMSHDFRTPMNAITGFNLLIAKNSDDPVKVREYTHKISLACQNLLSLLNDVLDMSKIESGKTNLTMNEFALGLLLEEVNSVIAFQAKGKQQDYQVHAEGIQHDTFIGDKQRINEILVNILGNSVKYTQNGGKIDFTINESASMTEGYQNITFIIKDNGLGMSEEFQNKIFEAFSREEKDTTKSIQGTGLGMAITKNLIELMGGSISVKSKEGEGSTFTVNLRLQVVIKRQDDVWSRHGINRILIVDENKDECDMITKSMDGTGVETMLATSSHSAIHLIDVSNEDHKSIDLVLIDSLIHKQDPVSVIEKIRRMYPQNPKYIILMSEDWSDIEDEARAAGVDNFMQKPFFRSTFKQIVEELGVNAGIVEQEEKLPLEGLRFLAAEDNEINADILIELMEMEGATVELGENGQIAVDMFKNSEIGYYNMVLTDIQMPVMNGYETARAIRELDREDAATIPIIAMTANAYADDVQKAFDAGMNAHVAKPIDIKVMEKAIREQLSNSKK
ncbi:MAG: response regulator [Butyrivibrio sp.]|nr:response regulator [Butyrivibrio sp.]